MSNRPLRFSLSPLLVAAWLALTVPPGPALAQSVMDNLPDAQSAPEPDLKPAASPKKLAASPQVSVASPQLPAASQATVGSSAPAPFTGDPYTIQDVNADMTADSAAHARDQALIQAQRTAFSQLCARLNAPDSAAKLSDDAIASLVASFEVQSEHLSAVRYIGVFTIRFKPVAVQRKIGKSASTSDATGAANASAAARPAGPQSHLPVTVYTDSLAAWAQAQRRLGLVPQISKIELRGLERGASHIELSYAGPIEDLENAVTVQGFVLRQNASGEWNLTDNSMVPR